MAVSQSEVRVRCEQCFVVFVSLEEFAHHGCVQQQMVDQNSRLDGIHDNHSWIPPQTHDQVDPSQLVAVVQPSVYSGQHSPQPQQQPQQTQQLQHQQQTQLQTPSQHQQQTEQQHQQPTHAINNLHLEEPSQELEPGNAAPVDGNRMTCTNVEENEAQGVVAASSTSQWTRDATLLLIQLYRDNESNFHRSNRKKKFVWQDIADTLRQHGHAFTRQQVEGRWKTLTAAYRRTTQHNITSMDRREWPFMEELRAVLDSGVSGSGGYRGYSGAFLRCRRSAIFNKRRMHLPKPRVSEQAEIIDWLSAYEQRHEQRSIVYMERLEKMHREKLGALTELVDVLKRFRR